MHAAEFSGPAHAGKQLPVTVPCCIQTKDLQERFELSKVYRDHINQIGADRALEDFLSAVWLSFNHQLQFNM